MSAPVLAEQAASGTLQADENNPMKIGLMVSSLGTQETGRSLFTGIFYHNKLWNAGHQLTVSYTGSEKFRNLYFV